MVQRFWTILVIVVAAVGLLIFASPANATEASKFEKYDTTQTWYAPSPASVDDPFAVPQTLTVLECGGIRQDDKYTIDTPELEKQYQDLIAGGVLNSKWEDAPFHPRGVVTALPDCAPVVVPPVTEEPPVVTPPVVEPPVIVPPVVDVPVDETPVDTTPVVDVAPVAAAPVEVAKVEAVQTDTKVLEAAPVADSLAYTGTNENLKLVWGVGIALAGLGLILVLVARLRRGPVKAGVVER
jgi:hypothetical protein